MFRPSYLSLPTLARRLFRAVFLVLAAGAYAAPPPAVAPDHLAGSYEYLVSYRATHNGALYKPADGPFKGLSLPYSFSDSEQYWGDYVCRQPSTSCAVADYYDPADYAIKARPGAGAILQSERVNVHNGTNIYDAATWQVAVVLGAVVNHYPNLIDADPYELASHQDEVLGRLHNVRDIPTGSRATTAGALYRYNGTSIADPRQAYAFRMASPEWLVPDPLQGPRYASVITVSALPANNPRYQPGLVSWSDWKPITGDNAWAFLVGPLQAAYLQYQVRLHGQYVPFASLPVQNALAVLPAFAAMQSACGAVYYAPSGTLENATDVAVDRADVSIENNLSLFAGLGILRGTLAAELAHEPSLGAEDRRRLAQSVVLIDTMLAGGTLPGDRHTRGLRDFLRRHAWREGEFVQAGFANEPGRAEEWQPVTEPRAVDVNTWGVAALGAAQIDAWFGAEAAYRLWESVKRWGGYGEGQVLYGVGYSDADGNGRREDGTYRSGVLSAEWTAGAIVAVRNMVRYYGGAPAGVAAPRARTLVAALKADEEAMLQGLERLRFDRYVAGQLPGKPARYAELVVEPASPIPSQPYLYSSRRYHIPFGWYGNPLPSTSSTAWALLVADHFDPFGYGGRPN